MRKTLLLAQALLFFGLFGFSQKKHDLYEQLALDYFLDSVWVKAKPVKDSPIYIQPTVSSTLTFLRAPFKFNSGKKISDSTEIEKQKERFKMTEELDLSLDSLIVDLDKTGFTHISSKKIKKVNLKRSKVIEVYKRLPFRPQYSAVEIIVSSYMKCDFYYFEIDESTMHVTRWYKTFLVY